MKQKVQLHPNQPLVEAELIEVEEARETWSEYKLVDGTVVRLKPIVTEIWKIEGQFDQEGNPQYTAKATLVVAARVPEHLKKAAVAPDKKGQLQ